MISGAHHAKDAQVVGLSAAAGKYNFSSTAIQQPGDTFTRVLHRCAGLLSVVMDRRGISEALTQIGAHGLQYLR